MTVQNPTKALKRLDTRQRAMLAEMGITVWLPAQNNPLTTDTKLEKSTSPTPSPSSQDHTAPTAAVPQQAKVNNACSASIQPNAEPTAPYCAVCTTLSAPQNGKNIARLPVDDAYPRWLFVLDAQNQAPPAIQIHEDKTQVLLRNMAAALRLQEQQTHHCHACACFRLALQNKKQEQTPQCTPSLLHEVTRIQPQIIVALGRQAAFSILGSTAPLGSLRNSTHHITIPQSQTPHYPEWITQIPVLVSYPLDYLLRTPTAKARAWQDLCLAHSVVHTTST